MKKSYDYFKTLKKISDEISVIYEKILNNEDYSSNRITFFAEKRELINNLQNEFITPLERGDIFLLSESLSAEINCIFTLQEYLSLVRKRDFEELENLLVSLKEQNIVFSQLKNFKSNIKLFEQCSQEINRLNTEKKKIEKSIVDVLNCKREQPLIKYATYSAFLDLNKKIYNTFVVIERILINNS